MQINKLTTTSVVVFIISMNISAVCFAQSIPEFNFQILTSENVQTIHLNNDTIVELRDVNVTPDYYIHHGRVSYHGQLVSFVAFNNHVYVADQTNQRIYKITHDNRLDRVIGGRGRGPGEFLDLFHLSATENYLFAQDRNQLKTIVFNKRLEVVAELPTGNSGVVAAGQKFTIVPGGFSSDHFFGVIESKPPFAQVGEFLTHVIPAGMQPSGYRFSRAVTNRRGDFLITINGLPYLFLFDNNLNHLQTIKLDGEMIQSRIALNPKPEPVQHVDIHRGGVHNIIGGMYLTETRDILFGIGQTLYRLEFVDGVYRFKNGYQFFASNETQREEDTPLGIFTILLLHESNKICFVSIHLSNLYCFDFE